MANLEAPTTRTDIRVKEYQSQFVVARLCGPDGRQLRADWRYDGSKRTFAPAPTSSSGRIEPAYELGTRWSREHLVLRFDHGRWVAIDDGSLNGMYVDGRQMSSVDIVDGCRSHCRPPRTGADLREVGRQHFRWRAVAWAGSPTGGRHPNGITAAALTTTSYPQPMYPSGSQLTTRTPSRRTSRIKAGRSVGPRCRNRSRRLSNGDIDGAGGIAIGHRQPRDEHAEGAAAGPDRQMLPGRDRPCCRQRHRRSRCWHHVTTPRLSRCPEAEIRDAWQRHVNQRCSGRVNAAARR
jgi:hypothetical protein